MLTEVYIGVIYCIYLMIVPDPPTQFILYVLYGVVGYRLQTELKYPSKNGRRFTQRYNMTKIIFS